MIIPFMDFRTMHQPLKREMEQAFIKVFDSNWFVLGKQLELFEEEYSHFNKTNFSVGVSNGLDALIISLRALGVQAGNEVILPSNTYIASAIAVSHVGATPVFVEPRENTFNLDPEKVEAAITSKTRAIMPVHLYGQPCEMNTIMSIANGNNLFVVEDNAQSHGATFDGRTTGSWGNLSGTSFYPGKNLGALGDGGAVTSDDEELVDKVRILRNYGSEKKYYNEVVGYNNRLDELQAAFLRVKLKHLNSWTKNRQQIANLYLTGLKDVGDLILPYTHPKATHVYHLFVIRTHRRDELQKHLSSKGIDTLIHYPVPPYLQKAYHHLGYKKGDFPIAERMAETCLSLPIYPGLNNAQIAEVVVAVKEFYRD